METPSSLLEGMSVTQCTGKHKLISVKATAGADVMAQVTHVPVGLSHLFNVDAKPWQPPPPHTHPGQTSAFFPFALFVFHL